MSFKINQEIWVYVERLYINCYSTEEFKVFLEKYGIHYDNEIYTTFNPDSAVARASHKIPLYIFMSEKNYDFANYMQTIATYKYLSILEKIVFDEKIIATRKDGWNYYGEPINGWHTRIVDLLRSSGVTIDIEKKKLSHIEDEDEFEGPDFLPYDFNDIFLDYIRKEINECYNNGQFLAVIILSRKLLEALSIRVMEIVFPKMISGIYNRDNHSLWYDFTKSRHLNLDYILENMSDNATSFDEDKDLIIEICGMVKGVKNGANRFVHQDYRIPDDEYLKSLKIEYAVARMRKVYKKYCNP